MGSIDPLIFIYLAFCLEDLGNFVVWLNIKSGKHLKPFCNQLIAFLSRDEIALIGKVPHTLCIVSLVYLPIKR